MEDGRDSAGKWNKAGMNDLAGRLNETLGRLFICLCMIRDTQILKMSAAQLTQQICCGLLTPAASVEVGKL